MEGRARCSGQSERRAGMSDNEIRQILIERKRQEIRKQNRAAVKEAAEAVLGWICLFGICFMLSAIG